MQYLWAFVVGGAICVAGQLLIDYTALTPARILTGYVVAGVVLSATGLYAPLVEFAGAGASVPLLGFGHLLAQGVCKAVAENGLIDLVVAVVRLLQHRAGAPVAEGGAFAAFEHILEGAGQVPLLPGLPGGKELLHPERFVGHKALQQRLHLAADRLVGGVGQHDMGGQPRRVAVGLPGRDAAGLAGVEQAVFPKQDVRVEHLPHRQVAVVAHHHKVGRIVQAQLLEQPGHPAKAGVAGQQRGLRLGGEAAVGMAGVIDLARL